MNQALRDLVPGTIAHCLLSLAISLSDFYTLVMITLIAAMDDEHLIGRGSELPWSLPADLRFFRKVTMGNAVVMGRKTWELVKQHTGKEFLDGRVNFVVTRSPEKWKTDTAGVADPICGPFFGSSLTGAVEDVRQKFSEFATEIFIGGGREIYIQALRDKLIDRMFITHVCGKHEGDVFFPEFEGDWVGRVLKDTREYQILEYVPKPK